MPNIATLLKSEIARLSRKEVRSLVEPTKKVAAQHRRYIAELHREVSELKSEVARLRKRVGANPPATQEAAATDAKLRWVAKGFRSHRNRLGLSAAEYGKLIGVSAQSVYNWEREVAVPRRAQLARIAALRNIGKREAIERLEKLDAA